MRWLLFFASIVASAQRIPYPGAVAVATGGGGTPPTFSAAYACSIGLNGSNNYVLNSGACSSITTTSGQLVYVSGGGQIGANPCNSWTVDASNGTNTDTFTIFPGTAPSTAFTCMNSAFAANVHAGTYTITVHATALSPSFGLFVVFVYDPGSLLGTSDTSCSGTTVVSATVTCSGAMTPGASIELILSAAFTFDNSIPAVGSCCGTVPMGGSISNGSGGIAGAYLIGNPTSGTYTPSFNNLGIDLVGVITGWIIK